MERKQSTRRRSPSYSTSTQRTGFKPNSRVCCNEFVIAVDWFSLRDIFECHHIFTELCFGPAAQLTKHAARVLAEIVMDMKPRLIISYANKNPDEFIYAKIQYYIALQLDRYMNDAQFRVADSRFLSTSNLETQIREESILVSPPPNILARLDGSGRRPRKFPGRRSRPATGPRRPSTVSRTWGRRRTTTASGK